MIVPIMCLWIIVDSKPLPLLRNSSYLPLEFCVWGVKHGKVPQILLIMEELEKRRITNSYLDF
jgi:hypothetical protein